MTLRGAPSGGGGVRLWRFGAVFDGLSLADLVFPLGGAALFDAGEVVSAGVGGTSACPQAQKLRASKSATPPTNFITVIERIVSYCRLERKSQRVDSERLLKESTFSRSAPKGAVIPRGFAISLKRYPDTNRLFSAASEATPFQNESKMKPLRSATKRNREMRFRTSRLAHQFEDKVYWLLPIPAAALMDSFSGCRITPSKGVAPTKRPPMMLTRRSG